LQPEWPHWQEISVLPDSPSQWALQYFEPGAAEQLQTGFAHLEALAMNLVLALEKSHAVAWSVRVRCRAVAKGGVRPW